MRRFVSRILGCLALALVAILPLAGPIRAADKQPLENPQLKTLVAQVSGPDTAKAIAAADGLGDLGAEAKPGVPALAKALASKDEALRWHAARALASIGPDAAAAVDALAAMLKDPSVKVRSYSAFALGRIGAASRPVATTLAEAVSDEDAQVRRASIVALRNIKPGADVIIPAITKVLKEADPALVGPTLASLAEGAEKSVPFLKKALADKDAAYWACLVASEIGPDAAAAVPELITAAQTDDLATRREAILALGQIGEVTQTLPALVKLLDDKELAIRITTTFAVGNLGKKAESATPKLEKQLKDKDSLLQTVSAWALTRINPEDASRRTAATPMLLQALTHKDPKVRLAALNALAEMQGDSALTLAPIMALMQDSDEAVAGRASRFLSNLGDAVVPELAKMLKGSVAARRRAVMMLGRLGAKAKSAVPALVSLAKDESTEVRRDVMYTLAEIGSAAEAVPAGLEALGDKDLQVRHAAAFLLGRLGSQSTKAVPALTKALADEDFSMQVLSAAALVRIDPSDATVKATLPILISALDSSRAYLRREAALAIAELGTKAASATDALKQAAEAEENLGAAAAIDDALLKVQGKSADKPASGARPDKPAPVNALPEKATPKAAPTKTAPGKSAPAKLK